VAHVVSFRSSKFDVSAETPNPINPIAGQSVLTWLRGELAKAHYTATEPGTEDWGWYIDVTGNDGSLEQQIAANATAGDLTVHAWGGGFSWTLDLGRLDPYDTDDGIKHRLHNLGFDVKPESHGWDEDAAAELKAFQYAAKIPVTGEVDDATRKKLLAWHDRA